MTKKLKLALASIALSLVAIAGIAASQPTATSTPTPAPATCEAALDTGAAAGALELVPQAKSCKPGWVCCEYYPIPNMGCMRCAPSTGGC